MHPIVVEMRNVLILEDNPGCRMALRAILEDSGYRVLEAADANTAIRVCSEHSVIDLLVADGILRSNAGNQAAGTLKALHPRMPILSLLDHPIGARIERQDFDSLRKPSIRNSFLETVESLLTPGRPTILVVDDQPEVRHIVRQFLVRREFEVLDAGDGPAALELAARHRGPIHLLITDIVMPEMDGWQLAGRLLAERPDLKVLYISGYSEAEAAGDQLDGIRAAFLAKPFAMGALLAKVERMLGAGPGRAGFSPMSLNFEPDCPSRTG